jgi:hypothetical protein
LLKGWAVIGNGSIFQEVRPEDKMATGLENGGIIVLSVPNRIELLAPLLHLTRRVFNLSSFW